MWPASDRYLATLKRSHTQVYKLDVLKGGAVVASITNGTLKDPNTGSQGSFLGGSVDVSSTAIRRNATIQLLDPTGTLTPDSTGDLLAPYITDVRIWVGVQYWDEPSVTEYVPLGTFVVHDPELTSNQLTLQGYDRMWLLANFPSPYVIPNGTNVADAITQILVTFMPAERLSYNITTTDVVIAGDAAFDADSSISEALVQLADVAGWKICCDPMGTFVTYVTPNSDDTPDLVLTPGIGSVMYKPQRQLGQSDVINAVVYTNEGGQNTPLRGIAIDTNPQSLTNADVIGIRPTFKSDPSLSSQAQVDSAARTALQSLLGTSDTLTVVMIPNYALDVDDVISVSDPTQAMDSVGVIVDNFNLPIRATDGIMTVQCKANVVVTAT